ncbi:MAG TPA: hypothetical protein PLB27_00570 [Bacteroidales bacterium]|nr:hypothetical protein [Bacteroidales bacterium]HOX73179.1 hypothetical protein [Bacteroidales bacterium]
MKKVIFFALILTIIMTKEHTVSGQDSSKLSIIEYLIKVGDLKPIENKQEYYNNIFITDLLTFKDIGNKEQGIFKFGTYSAHSKTYLLLRNKDSFQILDLKRLDEVLIKEISFLKEIKIPANESLKYIEATILVYQKNLKSIPWTE